jgi:alpha-galactosidase
MKIVIIGGGSRQWGPKLLADIVTTPALADATIVLHDIDAGALDTMQQYGDLVVSKLGVPARIETTTDRPAALNGADFVVVTISTGGFASMTHDLDVPARYGIRQSVGDSVGPGGISRTLRNVPVLLSIARDVERICPDAWFLNLTNPMTCLTRAIARETNVNVVGLCHEVGTMRWHIGRLCEVATDEISLTISGVNHLPWITEFTVGGDNGFIALRTALEERERAEQFRRHNRLKLALLDRFGALPGSGDRHVAEFFPWVLDENSEWGSAWNVYLTTIQDRQNFEDYYADDLRQIVAGEKDAPTDQSGEMVAPIIDSLVTGTRRELPLNLPNRGQAPYLPNDVVVETMCIVDGDGMRGRDAPIPPAPCAEWTRRHVAVQELTLEAALTGDRALVRDAMELDPLAGRLELRQLDEMTDELLTATATWLPQFA